MKRKFICMILSIAVVVSIMPFFTFQADAFSTGSKTLIEKTTVTIKPGKTYKTPSFKITEKMTFQVPVKIIPKDDVNSGSYVLVLKNSKDKTQASFKTSLKNKDIYDDWTYFYLDSISKPCFAKGKYYFVIKNTTNCNLKVTYSVKAYKKIASTGEFPEEMTMVQKLFQLLGKVGPGIPVVESVKIDNVTLSPDRWGITDDGDLYICPYGEENEDVEKVITVTLKNKGKNYKINLTVKGENPAEEINDTN